MLIDPYHTAFKDAVEGLNGVGRYLTTGIFKRTMVHRIVAGELTANLFLVPRLVRPDCGFRMGVSPQDRRNIGNRRAVDMEAASGTAALNERQNDILGSCAALGRLAFLPPD